MTDEKREPIKVICDILSHELGLDPGRIMIYNQTFKMPQDQSLFIVVRLMPGKIFANNNKFESSTAMEIKSVSMVQLLQIDVMSVDDSARTRYPEAIAALASIYAQQMCGEYTMNIGTIPSSVVDTSEIEETRIITRISITTAVHSLYQLEKSADYYNSFTDPDSWVNKKPEEL